MHLLCPILRYQGTEWVSDLVQDQVQGLCVGLIVDMGDTARTNFAWELRKVAAMIMITIIIILITVIVIIIIIIAIIAI